MQPKRCAVQMALPSGRPTRRTSFLSVPPIVGLLPKAIHQTRTSDTTATASANADAEDPWGNSSTPLFQCSHTRMFRIRASSSTDLPAGFCLFSSKLARIS